MNLINLNYKAFHALICLQSSPNLLKKHWRETAMSALARHFHNYFTELCEKFEVKAFVYVYVLGPLNRF